MRPRPRPLVVAATCLSAMLVLAGCTHRARPDETDRPSTSAPTPSAAATVTPAIGPVGADGCLDRLASGLTVRDVDVYQSVRVPMVLDGIVVPASDRTVDVVADKDAVIAVNVAVEPGWLTREVAVRVVVLEPSRPPTMRSQRLVPSVGARPDPPDLGDVAVDIPRGEMTSDARVSVAIVECTAESSAGAGGAPQPVAIEIDLAARQTGGIKIHLLPFEVAGFVPSTSDDVIDGYRDALLAMYPVTDVDISVGDVVDGGEGPDLGALLVDVGVIRDHDRPAKDVYYYGMVTGAPTRDAYCDHCITGTSEDGGGSGAGFAIGAAFGDQRAKDTFLHELGHAHGLLHAPCGDVDLVNEAYPHAGGAIGVSGYDHRTRVLVLASTADFMGYCFPRWISDHHYQRLVERVAAVNGQEASP